MKQLTAVFLALILAFNVVPGVHAQAAETIWMETSKDAYNAGEDITVTLKANTTTPIQGFTFQLLYDPACLEPSVPTSLIPGLNYMSVPQTAGKVEGIFASTAPLNVNGSLAEVKFKAQASCQTSLKLGKASLAVADASGMAVDLPGVSLGTSSLVLNVSAGGTLAPTPEPTATAHNLPVVATPTHPSIAPKTVQTPGAAQASTSLRWLFVPLGLLIALILFVGLIVTVVFIIRDRQRFSELEPSQEFETATIFIQRGAQAGSTLTIAQFPCRIGSDPSGDICLTDARIAPQHAEILADRQGYTLLDLGSPDGTYLNGKLIKNQQALLKPGDTLRMGGVVMVFGVS